LYKPLKFSPRSREGLTAEQLAGLASDLREYYRPRFPKEIMDTLTSEALLNRYFGIRDIDRKYCERRAHEVEGPRPKTTALEAHRIWILVQRAAEDEVRKRKT
jgi:hypothetical protein